MKKLLTVCILATLGLGIPHVSFGSVKVIGSLGDQNEFVTILNGYSTGGSWLLNASNELVFSGLPMNSFAFLLHSFNQQPGVDVTMRVGRGVPGVLLGRWNPSEPGVQDVDLLDFNALPDTDPNLFTKDAMIIHEVAEVFQSVLNGVGFHQAHSWALDNENSLYRSLFSNIQRLDVEARMFDSTGNEIFNGICDGFCHIFQQITLGGSSNAIVWDIFGTELIGAGSVNLGGRSDFASDVSLLGQRLLSDMPGNQTPDCSTVQPSHTELWPPNHRLQEVRLTGATDPDGQAVMLTIIAVTQDEPVTGTGDGDTFPDAGFAFMSNSDRVQLRRERSGRGDGRVYRIAFHGNDGRGGICSGIVLIGVPHSENHAALESADAVNSFGTSSSREVQK